MSSHEIELGKLKKGLKLALETLDDTSRASAGTGTKYHAFSQTHFSDKAGSDSYIKETGLEPTSVEQRWGTGGSHRLYRSRRGSISGAIEHEDGSATHWRLSSHATTKALAASSEGEALASYDATKAQLESRTLNSVGNETRANTVISDFGSVAYNPTSDSFALKDATHAMGVSGSALSSSVKPAAKRMIYAYSTDSMTEIGLTPSPAATYHSEPMALRGHDMVRERAGLDPLAKSTEMVGIMESNPNQICTHCAPMISQRVGTNSYVAGNPGIDFGGQKSGELHPSDVVDASGKSIGQATVARGTPSARLDPVKNREEVSALFRHHGKGSTFVAGSGGGSLSASPTTPSHSALGGTPLPPATGSALAASSSPLPVGGVFSGAGFALGATAGAAAALPADSVGARVKANTRRSGAVKRGRSSGISMTQPVPAEPARGATTTKASGRSVRPRR